MKICKVEGCDRKHRAKGYCPKHYLQVWKHGKILKRTMYDPNETIVKGDMVEIVLYNRKSIEIARTIIDSEDAKKTKSHKWCLGIDGYVSTMIRGSRVKLHGFVAGGGFNKNDQTDHRDRDKLNNRKSNLRKCFPSGNSQNRGKNKNNTSGYKGVWRHKQNKTWEAGIGVNRKIIYLGCYKEKKDAAKAYNKAALKYHGEFACLNKGI